MKYWRMSFRDGNQGFEMWPDCLRLGVAAITYDPLSRTDLGKYSKGNPKDLWDELKPTQKASLRRVVYEMEGSDVIYVKQGPKIVDKGTVKGPEKKSAYKFDSQFRLVTPTGTPWAHQVLVEWSRDFPEREILLGAEQLTVKELSAEEVQKIEVAIVAPRNAEMYDLPAAGDSRVEPLLEDAYYRESPARLKVIIPRHNRLSNDFCRWLKHRHKINAAQEQQRVDINFVMRNQTVLAELKICFGAGTTRSIREALGQILEYNHYPARSSTDRWLIVLDDEPSSDDLQFIVRLREIRLLPINVGWRSKEGFSFFPAWP